MNGINGIIVDGNVYEAVETGNAITCSKCNLKMTCENHELWEPCKILFGYDTHLRFSQELTDKLNNSLHDKE